MEFALVGHARCSTLRSDSWHPCWTPSVRMIAARLGAAGLVSLNGAPNAESMSYWADVVRYLERTATP